MIHETLDMFLEIDRQEKELIIASKLGVSREYVIAHPETILSQKIFSEILSLITKRKTGIPLAYLLGKKEFFGRDFLVNKNTLIPRPETEMLVEEALRIIHKKNVNDIVLVDVGTGTGSLPLSVLSSLPSSLRPKTFACDISKRALSVAQKNAENLSLSEAIIFFHSDLLKNFFPKFISLKNNSLLIITANLPYVPETAYREAPQNKESLGILFEPKKALVSGNDGLDHYRRLFRQLSKNIEKLPDQTMLLCEFFGDTTQKDFFESKTQTYLPKSAISIQNDLSGRPRMATITIQNTRSSFQKTKKRVL